MAISSISSSYNTHAAAAINRNNEEARVNERENDGDKDDQKVQAQSSAKPPEPTINTSGQMIGGIISVQA